MFWKTSVPAVNSRTILGNVTLHGIARLREVEVAIAAMRADRRPQQPEQAPISMASNQHGHEQAPISNPTTHTF
jgi:hypothetical protein